LIFTEESLYADAIAQFFFLTEELEKALARHQDDPMVQRVTSLGLSCASGYASDLEELNGPKWREKASLSRTSATAAYCKIIAEADAVETVGAAFILYGALVVGGGKSTQAKVKKIFPNCNHSLYDVGEDMKELRKKYMRTFTDIGKEWPGDVSDKLEAQAERFMALNNTVVLSIRCWGQKATLAALGAASVVAAVCVAVYKMRHN